jgi:hypothetical protein
MQVCKRGGHGPFLSATSRESVHAAWQRHRLWEESDGVSPQSDCDDCHGMQTDLVVI